MEDLIFYPSIFIILLITRLILYIISTTKKRRNKLKLNIELNYLVNKFKLDKKKILNKKIGLLISIIDAFILTLTLFLVVNITNLFILIMILGVLFIFLLIYVVYEIIGNILLKRGYGLDE